MRSLLPLLVISLLLLTVPGAAAAQSEEPIFLVTGWLIGDNRLMVAGEFQADPESDYTLANSLVDDCEASLGPGFLSGQFPITQRTDANGMAEFAQTFEVESSAAFLRTLLWKRTISVTPVVPEYELRCQPVRRTLSGSAPPTDDEQVTSEAEQLARAVEQIVQDDRLQAAQLVEGEVASGNSDLMIEVLEVMDSTSAGTMIDVMDAGVAAALWGVMDSKRAGPVLDAVTTEQATEIVSLVPEANLLDRMPEVTPQRMWAMPLELLIQKMPSAPVSHLDFWLKPHPAAERDAPVATELSETATEYAIAPTAVGEWSALVGSPQGIDRILARFSQERRDVKVFIERLGLESSSPLPELPPLPLGRIANAFFKIEVNNTEPEDVLATAAMFSVEKSWIAANQVHKWSVEFSRLDEETSTWIPHPSKRIGEDAERINFVTVLPGFSTLAITGAEQIPMSTFEITDLVIEPSQPVAGEAITISATVTNTGATLGVYPSTLWIDNEIERHLSVVVRLGESAPTSFTITRPEGTYRTRVGKLLGEFTVAPITNVLSPVPSDESNGQSGGTEPTVKPPSVGGLAPSDEAALVLATIGLALVVVGIYTTLAGTRRRRITTG